MGKMQLRNGVNGRITFRCMLAHTVTVRDGSKYGYQSARYTHHRDGSKYGYQSAR